MKHLLNNLSEHEKNHIREQHTDKIKIDTSKFRKLMESKLGDVKLIKEEDMGGKIIYNISKDLQSGDILFVKDKENKDVTLTVLSSQPMNGFTAKDSMGKKMNFIIGSGDNQLRFLQTQPGDFEYTVVKIKVGESVADVNSKGEYFF